MLTETLPTGNPAGSPMLQSQSGDTDALGSAGNIEEKVALQCARNKCHRSSGCLWLRLALERRYIATDLVEARCAHITILA